MGDRTKPQRCQWVRAAGDRDVRYHDDEWCVPVHDDSVLFEFLTLEGAQAGLSWTTILKKRANYRRVFAGFDAARVARFNRRSVERLMGDAGIVRNRLKIESTLANARAVLRTQQEFGSLDAWIWTFVGGVPRQNGFKTMADLPASTPASLAMSKELKRRGFRFVGPTTCYAFMQAVGMVNDHTLDCFRHGEVAAMS